jgi:hypothetical protein
MDPNLVDHPRPGEARRRASERRNREFLERDGTR